MNSNHLDLRIHLRDEMFKAFGDDAIRDICFELDEDYENLKGEGKAGKIRELIVQAYRTGRSDQLIKILAAKRPNIEWLPEDQKNPDDISSLVEFVVNGRILTQGLILDYPLRTLIMDSLINLDRAVMSFRTRLGLGMNVYEANTFIRVDENKDKMSMQIIGESIKFLGLGITNKKVLFESECQLALSIHNISQKLLTRLPCELAIRANHDCIVRSPSITGMADLPDDVRSYSLADVERLYPDAWRTIRFEVLKSLDLNSHDLKVPLHLIAYSVKGPLKLSFSIKYHFSYSEDLERMLDLVRSHVDELISAELDNPDQDEWRNDLRSLLISG